jgi:glutamyl-tRNA synthetase
MPSTPKHIVLYKAFDWEPPTFAHVGLLLDDSRQKLSKRGLASDIRGFERDGFFAEALINFVALFGWSHRLGDDFINLQELVRNVGSNSIRVTCMVRLTWRQFDLKFTKGNTIASPLKLFHLQRRYAEKYVKEGGKEYESMIDRLHTVVAKHLAEYPG